MARALPAALRVQVHCVRAFGAVHDSLRRLAIAVPVVLHSWTGATEMTAALAQLPNVYFSLSGHLAKLAPHKALPMVSCSLSGRLRVGCGVGSDKGVTGQAEQLVAEKTRFFSHLTPPQPADGSYTPRTAAAGE